MLALTVGGAAWLWMRPGLADAPVVDVSTTERTVAGTTRTPIEVGDRLAKAEASARAYRGRAHGFGQLMFARTIDGVARLVAVLLGQGTVEEAIDATGDRGLIGGRGRQ